MSAAPAARRPGVPGRRRRRRDVHRPRARARRAPQATAKTPTTPEDPSLVWLSRCSGNQEFVKRDWAKIQDALRERGRPADSVKFAHCNFTYLVETSDRQHALDVRRDHFLEVMGTQRSFEHLQESYLLGSLDEIVERLVDLKDAGMERARADERRPGPARPDLQARGAGPGVKL